MDDSAQASSGTSYLGNPTGVNDFRLRRAEIKLSGKVTPAWGYEVMIDPTKSPSVTAGADGKILQDLGITYLGLKGHEFTLGQKKIAITEEGLRSSSEIDFIERARITRIIGDQRQAGFFYKGEYGHMFAAQASITNGLPSNVAGTSDRLFYAARFDVKPMAGMVVGISGGTGNQGAAALTRDRLGAHFRWDGTETLPLMLRAEYGKATDGQTNGTEIDRDGYYVSGLYTFAKQFRLGARYEMYDQNTDVDERRALDHHRRLPLHDQGEEHQPQGRVVRHHAGRPEGQQRPRRDVQPVRHRRPGRFLATSPRSRNPSKAPGAPGAGGLPLSGRRDQLSPGSASRSGRLVDEAARRERLGGQVVEERREVEGKDRGTIDHREMAGLQNEEQPCMRQGGPKAPSDGGRRDRILGSPEQEDGSVGPPESVPGVVGTAREDHTPHAPPHAAGELERDDAAVRTRHQHEGPRLVAKLVLEPVRELNWRSRVRETVRQVRGEGREPLRKTLEDAVEVGGPPERPVEKDDEGAA